MDVSVNLPDAGSALNVYVIGLGLCQIRIDEFELELTNFLKFMVIGGRDLQPQCVDQPEEARRRAMRRGE